MTGDSFRERWEANKDRPAWVQENRDDLMEATGVYIPRGRDEIADLLDDKKGVITRELPGGEEDGSKED